MASDDLDPTDLVRDIPREELLVYDLDHEPPGHGGHSGGQGRWEYYSLLVVARWSRMRFECLSAT
jgi:hypothetical protein